MARHRIRPTAAQPSTTRGQQQGRAGVLSFPGECPRKLNRVSQIVKQAAAECASATHGREKFFHYRDRRRHRRAAQPRAFASLVLTPSSNCGYAGRFICGNTAEDVRIVHDQGRLLPARGTAVSRVGGEFARSRSRLVHSNCLATQDKINTATTTSPKIP